MSMTDVHIRDLIGRAADYCLDLGPHLAGMSVAEIAAAYNGIGAEWMTAAIRDRLTTDYADIEPAAMIHDVDFDRASGTLAEFREANARLRANIIRTANAVATPWISWRWWRLRLAATACYEAVEQFGLIAYIFPTTQERQKQMNKLTPLIILIALALTGCQTSITAEKYPEQVLPIQEKVTINGEEQLITTHYQIASGGWYATARSPLYAAEALDGLELGVHTNGSVTLALSRYNRDLSTNAVQMVDNIFKGSTNLVTSIGEAYARLAGGASADTVLSVAQKAYSLFRSSGGNAANATVATGDQSITISDGSVCVTCDADGNCTPGVCTD